MIVRDSWQLSIASTRDLVEARKSISALAESLGMSRTKETELRTAVTELLTNMLRYAGSGKVRVECLDHRGLKGLRASFQDQGPGIADTEAAMSKGFSTGKSLGYGLSGCKNLVDSFDMDSVPGKGTSVVITKWC